jgi:hypothetical protein
MESDTEIDTASNDLATVDLTSSDLIDPVDTSSSTFDPDETISEDEEEELRLARNGYNHNGKFSYLSNREITDQAPKSQLTTSPSCTRDCTSEPSSIASSTPFSKSTTKTKKSKQQ